MNINYREKLDDNAFFQIVNTEKTRNENVKREGWLANKHMKRCHTSYIIRKCKVKQQ